MSTIRVADRRRWVAIANEAVNDDRLSFRARGVLVWLLSKPDGWTFTRQSIAEHGKEGESAIRAVLVELRDAGYIVRQKTRRADGRIVTETVLYEVPPDAPEVGNQPPDRRLENRPPVNQPPVVSTESNDLTTGDPAKKLPVARPRNEVWDALVDEFGDPATASEKSMYGKVVRELKEAGATYDSVRERAKEGRRRWNGKVFSPMALSKHWTSLGRKTTGNQEAPSWMYGGTL